MIQRLGDRLTRLSNRWMPDPFILALLLVVVAALLAWLVRHASMWQIVGCMRPSKDAFWLFLEFSMQMCLVLMGGSAIATSPPVRAALARLARLPLTTGPAAALVSFCAMSTALVNWGMGLLVGAYLARELGLASRRAGRKLHYPLLGAAGYSGLMNWHGGLSGSGPLDVAAWKTGAVPLAETIGLPMNLVLNVLLLLITPLLFWAMAPKREEEILEASFPEAAPPPAVEKAPVQRIENSLLWTIVFGAAAAIVIGIGVHDDGWKYFNLYTVTFLFLFAGWILHGSPMSFAQAVYEGAQGCGGIILQFPFYATIAAIISGTGLQDSLQGWTESASRACAGIGVPEQTAFLVLTFIAACILNLFVTSGGGLWKIQKDFVLAAAAGVGAPAGKAVMMVAYGDELTNMIQPFWALALLGVTGLGARQIMGYTTAVMLIVFPIYLACIVLL